MDKIPFKLIFWVLVVAGMVLKPVLQRRLKRKAETERRRSAAPAPEGAEGHEDEGDPKLPYEELVDEVFGSYISRRRQEAQPQARPKPSAGRRVPAQVPSRTPTAAAEPPRSGVVTPVAAPQPLVTPGEETRLGRESVPIESAVRRCSVEQHLFGRRPLSSAARLIIAAEILRPPRILRERGKFWNR